MKNWKKAIALVASAAVSVAACGSSNAGGSSDSGKKTVGFVAVGPEGGFRTANEKDIQQAFEDAGFDLTYSPTQNNDQQKQIQAFNKFVNDEVDAIILSSTEDSGWDDSLKKAAEAEIPVFTVDRNVDVKDAEAKKAIVAHIGPSNVWCGEQAAEFVNKNFPDGANGFILEGPAGLSVVLGFIGVKLIMEALHGNTLPFINGGEGVHWVPEVPTWLSLAVIVLAIGGASVASVIKMKSMESAEKA